MVVGESAMEVKDRTEAEEERGRKRDEIETQFHTQVGGAAEKRGKKKKGSLTCDGGKEASVLSDGSFPHTPPYS